MIRRAGLIALTALVTSLILACGTTREPAPFSTPGPPIPTETQRLDARAAEAPVAESTATSIAESSPAGQTAAESAALALAPTTLSTPASASPPSASVAPAPSSSALPRTAGVTTVIIDPGHGGDEVGAANFGIVEKDSNLELAFRVERLLAERGLRPLLTRRSDTRAAGPSAGAPPSGFSAQRIDLQARVDLANTEGAAAFVSIHSNGSASAAERGLEVYYNSQRPHAQENRRLARLVHDGVTNELLAAGYAVTPRGVKDDSCLRAFQGRCFPLFLLGPERITTREEILRRGGNPDALLPQGLDEIRSRATQMPAALAELLFVSNSEDAAILRSEAAREAMARGVARGVARFLGVE